MKKKIYIVIIVLIIFAIIVGAVVWKEIKNRSNTNVMDGLLFNLQKISGTKTELKRVNNIILFSRIKVFLI